MDESQSTMGNPLIKDIQKDILFFKDEVLRDMRKIELQLKSRLDKNVGEIEKKVVSNENNANELKNKLNALTQLVNSSNAKIDKIEKMSASQTKLEEKLINNEVKLNSAIRELSDSCFKYDKLYLNNLFVPGFIGEHCKFPNLKEYIQWLNTQISALNSFKDKQLMDLKAYKSKLDGLFDIFQNSVDRIKGNFIEYCNQCVGECETRFKQRIVVTEELIEGLRTENSTHALMLRNEAQKTKMDWEKMLELKETIYAKMKEEVDEFKNAGKKNIESCSSFQKEFQLIKAKFTDLSEFIRDVRFRRGMEVKRTEYWEMTKKLNFNLKKNNNLSPRERDMIKAEETVPEILETNYNKDEFVKRRETKFPSEIIQHKIDVKALKEDNEESGIKKVKSIKFSQQNTIQLANKVNKGKENNNNKVKTILLKRESEKKLNIDKSLTEFNLTPKEDNRELQAMPLTPISTKTKPKLVSFVKANELLSTSPIKINESKENIDGILPNNNNNQIQLYMTQKKDTNNTQMKEQQNVKVKKKQSNNQLLNVNGNGNLWNVLSSNREITPNTYTKGNPTMIKNNVDDISSQNKDAYEIDNSKDNISFPKISPKSKEHQLSITKVGQKFCAIENRIVKVEQSTKKRLEMISLQLKTFIDQFTENRHSTSNNIKYLHSGFFVPMAFDDKNVMSYFPDKHQRMLNQSRSQIYHNKNKEEFYFPQPKRPLNKIFNKKKKLMNSHTYSSLSVLLTNNPKSAPSDGTNLLLNSITSYNDKEKGNQV